MSEKWLVREAVPNFVDKEWEPVQLVDSYDKITEVPFIKRWKDQDDGLSTMPFSHFEIKPHGWNGAQKEIGEHIIIAYFSSGTPSKWVVGYCTPENSEMAKDWRYKRNIVA
jgi:hypothetical protein